MITDLILAVLTAPVVWLLDNVPSFSWPTWMTGSDLATKAGSVAGNVQALDNWIPVGDLALAATLVLAVWAFSLVVQGLRMVVSLFSGGGGSL